MDLTGVTVGAEDEDCDDRIFGRMGLFLVDDDEVEEEDDEVVEEEEEDEVEEEDGF